jgi:hypothetical protein
MYSYAEALDLLKESSAKHQDEGGYEVQTPLKGLGLSLGGEIAGTAAALPVLALHHHRAKNNPHKLGSGLSREMHDVKKTMRELYPHMGDVGVRSTEELTGTPAMMQRIADHYNPGSHKIMVASKSPEILAHELGHASGRNSILQRLATNKGLKNGGTIAGLGLLGHEDTRDYAAPVYAASRLPLLMEEGRASMRALKALHKLKGGKGISSGLKTLLPAFATYAAPAVAGTAGIHYAANHLGHKGSKHER